MMTTGDGKYQIPTRFGRMLHAATRTGLASGGPAGAAAPSPTLFTHDEWVLGSGGAQTKTLTFLPVDGSAHVYLNGVYQREGTDYTLTDETLDVLTAMAALTGDVLDVRYAYAADSPVSVAESHDSIEDTFDRADGTALVADRSDGGVWTIGVDVPWSINSNRLVRASGSGLGPLDTNWIADEHGAVETITIAFDVSMTALGGGRARVFYGKFLDGTGGYQIECYEGGSSLILRVDGGTTIATYGTASYTTAKRISVTHNLLTGAYSLSYDGTVVASGTGALAGTTGTWIGFFLDRAYSENSSYYDNVVITMA